MTDLNRRGFLGALAALAAAPLAATGSLRPAKEAAAKLVPAIEEAPEPGVSFKHGRSTQAPPKIVREAFENVRRGTWYGMDFQTEVEPGRSVHFPVLQDPVVYPNEIEDIIAETLSVEWTPPRRYTIPISGELVHSRSNDYWDSILPGGGEPEIGQLIKDPITGDWCRIDGVEFEVKRDLYILTVSNNGTLRNSSFPMKGEVEFDLGEQIPMRAGDHFTVSGAAGQNGTYIVTGVVDGPGRKKVKAFG